MASRNVLLSNDLVAKVRHVDNEVELMYFEGIGLWTSKRRRDKIRQSKTTSEMDCTGSSQGECNIPPLLTLSLSLSLSLYLYFFLSMSRNFQTNPTCGVLGFSFGNFTRTPESPTLVL